MRKHINSRWATIGLCLCACGVVLSGLINMLAGMASAAVPDDVLFSKTAVNVGQTTETLPITNGDNVPRTDVAVTTATIEPPSPISLNNTVTLINDDTQLLWVIRIGNNQDVPATVHVIDQFEGMRADYCIAPNGDRLTDSEKLFTFTADATLLPSTVIEFVCVSTIEPTVAITLTPNNQTIDVGQPATFTLAYTAEGVPFSSITVTTPDLDCDEVCSVPDVVSDFTQTASIVATLALTNNVQVTMIDGGVNIPNTTVTAVATYTATFTDEAEAAVTVNNPLPVLDVKKTSVQNGTTLTWTVVITNDGLVTATLYIYDKMQGIQADYCLDPNGAPLNDTSGNELGKLTSFTRVKQDVLKPSQSIQFTCVATVDPTLNIEKSPPIQTIMMTDTATFNIAITATASPTSELQFENITISDPASPACEQVTIAPTVGGFNARYSCDEPMVTADITNVITVMADIKFSNTITVVAMNLEASEIPYNMAVTDVVTTHIIVSDTAVALVDVRATTEEGISLIKQSDRDEDTVTYTIRLANSNLAASPPLTVTDKFSSDFSIQSCDYIVMDDEAEEITDKISEGVLTHLVQLPAGTEAEIVCVGTLTMDNLVVTNIPRLYEVSEGANAVFTVTIANVSNIDLADLTITSNITCSKPEVTLSKNSETDIICTHRPTTEPITATVTASAIASYLNLVTVESGREQPFFEITDGDELTVTLTDTDSASVTILPEPDIALVKTAVYQSLPNAPDIVTYTISVTNTGTLSATYFITDYFPSLSTTNTAPTLDAQCNGGAPTSVLTAEVELEPNEVATFVCVGKLDPALTVTKTAISPNEIGGGGEFTTTIHNQGNTDLEITLTDDRGNCATAPTTSSYYILHPYEVQPCRFRSTVEGTDITKPITSTSHITGTNTFSNTASASIVNVPDSKINSTAGFSVVVTDVSTAVIMPYTDYLSLEKTTNGFDVNEDEISINDPGNVPDDLIIPVGDPIQWDYIIKNQSDIITLTGLALSDNDLNIGKIDESKCNASLNVLGAGQTITCTVTSTAVYGQYVNVAVVTGTVINTEISTNATDWSAYLGVTPTTTLGTVSGVVFHDVDNDGQNETDPGLQGILVVLKLPDDTTRIKETDENGHYQFRNLFAGEYRLNIDTQYLPNDKLGAINSFDPDQPEDESGAGDNATSFTITSTMTTTVQSFGYHFNTVGKIGGTIFHDEDDTELADDTGLANVVVELSLPDEPAQTAVTDENGRYAFSNLPINEQYEITVITASLPSTKPNATNSSDPDLTADSRTTITLTNERSVVDNLNFRYLNSVDVIGTVVNDFDGIPESQDEQGISNVDVYLLDENRNLVEQTTTDEYGYYSFQALSAGNDYTIEIVTNTLPTSTNSGMSTYPDPNPIKWEADTPLVVINFGFRPFLGTVEGIVYHDNNQDSVLDTEETFQSDVTVVLTNDENGKTRTAVTDQDGQYHFDQVMFGQYRIVLVNETFPADKQCLSQQKSTVNITTEQPTRNVQFGLIGCPDGIIGNRVWSDNDGDLMYDPNSDTSLSGIHITLTLLLSGTPTDAILTTTTDADGLYQFNNLPIAAYEVVVDTSSLPEERQGWVISVDPDGVSLDGRSIVILNSTTRYNLDQDFAFGQIPTAVRFTQQDTLPNTIWTAILSLVGVTVYLIGMSSFSNPHYMYLFEMRNGKQKLAYGSSPEDALNILRMRLSDEEMALIIPDQHKKISQRKMQEHIDNLG